MKYIYTGPSWAASSYPQNSQSTNLAQQWGFDYKNASLASASVLDCVSFIKQIGSRLPVIWIYNEPIDNLKPITGFDFNQLLKRSDWLDIWHECNNQCLHAIDQLGVPVLLIGGHSDVVDCNYKNITVGHPSWQKWLAEQAGIPINNGTVTVNMDDGGNFSFQRAWGAEIIHKFMHEHPDIDPDPGLVNSIWDMFFFWKQLEKSNLFYEVHPNYEANVRFAEFLHPTVIKFLEDNQ